MKTKIVRTGILAALLFAALLVLPAQPAHAAACTFTSNVSPSGNWNAAGSWSAVGTGCSSYPGQTFAGDTVIIADGDTITLNTNVTANPLASLQVGQGTSGTLTVTGGSLTTSGLTINNGGTLTVNDSTNRTITVNGSITINSGGSFVTANASTANTHTLNIQGNLTNNGTLDFVNGDDFINVNFTGTANQTVSGTGVTTDFNLITINNSGADGSNIVDVTSTNFTVPANFLTLTDGWFRLSTGATLDLSGANLSLTAPDGFIVNHTSAVVNIGNNDILVNGGNFQLIAGTVNLGNGNDLFQVSSGSATLSGGIINIQGQFQMTGGTTTIDGATISIDPQTTNNLGTTVHIFEAQGNSNVTFTSGTVVVVDPHARTGTGNAVQIVSGAGTKNFAGSTIQLGNGTSTTSGSADGFDVNCGSGLTLGNLVVNNPSGTNRHVRLVTNNCILGGNLTITVGEFRLNGFNLTLAGNFTNNGTFTPGTNTVTFNGSSAQTIGGTSATTFNNLTINNANDVTLAQNVTVNSTLALTAGDLIAGNGTNQLLLGCTGAVTSAGGGDVVGDVVRTCAFVAGTNYTFNRRY